MKNFLFRQWLLLSFLLPILLAISPPLQAQNWQQVINGGGQADDRGTKAAVDAAGNTYVVGSFRGTAFFGNSILSSAGGSEDLFVAKLSAGGQYLWAVRAGGTTADRATDVVVDVFGNLYITGYFSGTANFGVGNGSAGTTLTTPHAYNAFVAQLNPATGALQWVVPASNSESQGLGLAVDGGGTLYLTGHFRGTAAFGQSSLSSFSPNTTDLFVASLNPFSQAWFRATRGGGVGDDAGTSITADSSSNVFVTGYFNSGGPGSPAANFDNFTLASSGGRDAFVGHLNWNGQWQWVTKGGGASDDAGTGVALDRSGNVCVVGRFSSSSSAGAATFGPTIFTNSGPQGSTNAYVGRLSAGGIWQWVTRGGPQDSNEAHDVAVDAAGNLYVTGAYGATGSTFGGTTLASAGATDIFVARLSSQGLWQWAVGAGGWAGEYGSGLVADAAGNLTLIGSYDSDTARFGPIWAGACCGANAYDMFVARLSKSTQGLTISSFAPASGPVGTTVTVTGVGFSNVQHVRFNGANATGVNVQSATQLQCVVPSGATTGPVLVQTSTGIATSTGNFTVTVSPPNITAFSPTSGPVGTVVTITGANLTGATQVRFNTTVATFTINSPTQITATVPAGAATGLLTVVTPTGTATSAAAFTVVPPPVITSFTPTAGKAGITVTLTGTGFSGATSVAFNGVVAAGFTVGSATSITATVPATASTGPLSVTTSGGTAMSAGVFTVQPVISGFTPTPGAPVGATVTITGTGLLGTTSILFNGVMATSFAVASATQLTAVVPPTATSGKISVVTPAGTAISTVIFKVVPTVGSFSPAFGTPHAPATVVTITGTGFLGATGVKFGTGICPAGTFTVVNATTITATVPAGATTGKIYVTTPGGLGTSAGSFGVAPTVSGFTPGAGAPGSVVLLHGLNFTSTTTVKFNGTPATVTYNSVTQVTAIVPAGATTGPLTATTVYGTHTSTGSYAITAGPAPTITSFSPTANVLKGTMVTITGTGFTGASMVRFNNVNTTAFTLVSSTQVLAAVPTGATTGKVYVVTPKGMAQSATSLTIIQPPLISNLSPASGSPGSVVLLGGANLTNATSVLLNGVAVPYTVNSSAQIVVTIPAGATSGKFSVTTIAGTGQSTPTFTVTSTPPPTIAALSSASAPRGATVVLTGTNFTGVTAVKVNMVALTNADYTVVSPTQISLTVPATATTGRIYVTAAGGMAQSAVLTVVMPPTIGSFTPTSGRVGTLVTINGSNFAGTTSVKFGGVTAASFTIVSGNRITATVPSGAVTGKIQVVNAAGTATSAGTFTLLSPKLTVTGPSEAGPVRVALFPNPATEWVGVEVSGLTTRTTTTVELLDATGHVVYTVAAGEGYTRLPVTALAKGLYIVRAGGRVQRLVVE